MNGFTYKPYFSICLDVHGKNALVVGGGETARRRTASLRDAGAELIVVSPTLESVLEYMAFQKEIEWRKREFKESDLSGVFIVIAATEDRQLNHKITELCREKNILCNVIDAPEAGSFIVPSTVERGPLTIAVSTSGINPTLASSIRQELEMAYGEEYGLFLELIAAFRPVILEEFPSLPARQKIYDRMISSRALSLLRNGMQEEARKELMEIIYDVKQDSAFLKESLPLAQPSKIK